jgi:hypothetical protein
MTDAERRTLRTLCATWLPRDAVVPVDAIDVRADEAVASWLADLPALHRTRLRAVLRSVETGFGWANGKPGTGFSDAPPDARREFLEARSRGRMGPDLAALRREAQRAWIAAPAVRAHLAIETKEAT